MAGITFFQTEELEEVKDFYINKIGMNMWVDQGSCIILQDGNMLLGFCEGDKSEKEGVITFFYDTEEEVDEKYESFKDLARGEPEKREAYNIYNFFAEDIQGRTIEFQTFLHDTKPFREGTELLKTRRSVRDYKDKEIPKDVLASIFEECRFAPTSMNSESYYFIPIKDREIIEFMSKRRGNSSSPIKEAPMAVAICCDPDKTGRVKQDGDIAAYHFILSAWAHGLGTCWIAAMDREDVKEKLEIPQDHFVATVTPLGYPEEMPDTPSRKPAEDYVKKWM